MHRGSTIAPGGDFDNDGVVNALEFVLGGTAATNDPGRLPEAATSGTDMTFPHHGGGRT